MEQTSPDIRMGIGKIRVERMITLSLQSVDVCKTDISGSSLAAAIVGNCRTVSQETLRIIDDNGIETIL